jgi:acetolactate synthase-1/2/3 large subunit
MCECPAIDDIGNWGQQGDHTGMYQATAKKCFRVTAENAAQTIHDAFRVAVQPRLGPVLVELPRNLGKVDAGMDLTVTANAKPRNPDPSEIDAACDMVATFKKPVIIAGDDVRREGVLDKLEALAKSLQAAVLVTMDGRGVFPETDSRFGCVYIGTAPQYALYRSFLNEADGVLVIGADGRMKEARWDINVPVCELLIGEEFPALSDNPTMRLNGRLSPSLDRLLEIRNAEGFPESRIAEIRASVRTRYARPEGAQFTANDIIAITREQLPAEGYLFSETGVAQSMLEHLWPATLPDTFFGTTVGRTMGLTLPAMLGAKLARPDHPMVGFTTDGSALMRLGDLEAYARTGAAAPIVIMNDRALGIIRSQQKFKDLPDYGLGLEFVDFAKIAQAVGLGGVTVDTPEGFAAALSTALTANTATVIDARVDPQAYRDSFIVTTGIVDDQVW